MPNPLNDQEISKLVVACRNLVIKERWDLKTFNYLDNIILTVLDFQMDSNVVMKALHHFRACCHRDNITNHASLVEKITTFPKTEEGSTNLALYLWGYRHPSLHPESG